MEGGQPEERVAAEHCASDRIGGHRAEYHQAEGAGLEIAEDQLQSEEHAGDRSIERRRDPAGRAAGNEQPQLTLGQPDGLSESRTPSAEPIWTIGPSRPTDPPEPMQIADASDFTTGTCGRMRPP